MFGTNSYGFKNVLQLSLRLIIIFFLLNSSNVTAKDGFTVLRSERGALIVWNALKAYFTVELPGTSFKHVPMEGVAFLVDGHFVQVLLADPAEFSKTDDSPETILQKHRDWEIKH